jgi:hypothetical protein
MQQTSLLELVWHPNRLLQHNQNRRESFGYSRQSSNSSNIMGMIIEALHDSSKENAFILYFTS